MSKRSRKVSGRINASIMGVSDWLKANAGNNNIMTFWGPDQRAIYLLTEGRFTAERIPFLQFRYQNRVAGEGHIEIRDVTKGKLITDKKILSLDDAIFVSSAGRKYNPRRISVRVLYESQLLEDIKRKKIKYIVVGEIHNFLSLYFLKSPFFEKMVSFGNGEYQIFKVKDRLRPISHQFYVTKRTTSWLKDLKNLKPEIFSIIKNDVFMKKIGFSDAKIEKILNGQFGSDLIKVELFKVYE